ncbi:MULTISPECIES: ABC transporter ATP-binding protein [Rhizobium/Agrobacterium group]|jgi:putative ABC transport system ATP-binding protein|uniref:ABC transporter ATP-binding protein n=2 Tax=Rhizobium/Agrobacterium group TaxID=227290 RepID=A0A1B9TME6_AGRTU|nr:MULTISPECIES: ABC transporter ATP-binding protein [Rhizobium/Agrobacterium group]AHK02424.1 ABC transporter, permease protein [Agrobacterium tumefaciens LBA4213 (Ach5)]AKC08237.1 ABC transporter, nucleotide binding/ATPase protein [Agrobacterium tumefaciens]EHJ96988.1 ABC transporter nucleotide-binding protein/ATPase [Agrobacterium tumefaciens 5A]MDP9563035.1 putative ABC transport system ATP-binding protein [Rhizobium nepotum]QDG91562.1 ABC transporter ATP-binding protein [Rhizobium sp. NIB
MEQSLTRYIWSHTKRQQLFILLIVALSMIPYFLAFDLPKQIVNGPIQGDGFEGANATQLFMHLTVDIPYWGTVTLFPGLELNRMSMLMALSLTFLALVVINGLFKYYINTFKGRLGERLLRRIRFELIDRILRFPPTHFKRVKGAEISSMVKDEVEPLGGFTGDAFVQPALLGGQALSALFFILVQNFWLGLIAAFMAAIQVGIIPKMRRRLIELGRQRQLSARQLAGRIGEMVDGIGTIHAYDTSNFERADASHRLGDIFRIRYDLYQWKFLVKFINNFLAQLTPFFFYALGGYLTLKGSLDVGQLVAVINAYKELPGPLKELIDWDQARQDVQVKYEQVFEQFDASNMIDDKVQKLSPGAVAAIAAPIVVSNLTLEDDSGSRLLEQASLKIEAGEVIAIVGGSGAEALADAIGRTLWPTSGKVSINDVDILELPESLTGRRISYVSSDSYFFHASLKDNLLYGLKHAPLVEKQYEGAALEHRKWEIREAKLAGNPTIDINSEWIDYASSPAGDGKPENLIQAVLAVLDSVELSQDILEFALRSTIDPLTDLHLAARIVELRHVLRAELEKENLSGLIAPFELESYNSEATVGENLLFGTMRDSSQSIRTVIESEYFRSLMRETGLVKTLFEMGYTIAENIVEIFADLPGDHPFFQQLTFMTPDDVPVYQQMLQRLQSRSFDEANESERRAMLRLSFFYIEPRQRFGLLSPEIMNRIVEVRHMFHENLPDSLKNVIEIYDPTKYMSATSLLDNILFGKVSHRYTDASRRITHIVAEVMRKQGVYERVLAVGLDFNLGAGGKRLGPLQRQKLNLARALIRKSDYYVFNRPLPGLDPRQQEEIVERVITFLKQNNNNPAIVWVLSNATLSRMFDRVIVVHQGLISADGSYETLAQENGTFKDMVAT